MGHNQGLTSRHYRIHVTKYKKGKTRVFPTKDTGFAWALPGLDMAAPGHQILSNRLSWEILANDSCAACSMVCCRVNWILAVA